jgi:hypothetical protein
MLQATGSSQLQMIFMPSLHFSNFISQRGNIIMLLPAGMPVGAPIADPIIPALLMPGRSIIIVPDIIGSLPSPVGPHRSGAVKAS